MIAAYAIRGEVTTAEVVQVTRHRRSYVKREALREAWRAASRGFVKLSQNLDQFTLTVRTAAAQIAKITQLPAQP